MSQEKEKAQKKAFLTEKQYNKNITTQAIENGNLIFPKSTQNPFQVITGIILMISLQL